MMLEITEMCGRIKKGGIFIQNRGFLRSYITSKYRNKTIKEIICEDVHNSAITSVRLHNSQ